MGSAGFEPTTSSARGWHPTKLDYDPSFFISEYYMILYLLCLGQSILLSAESVNIYDYAKSISISSLHVVNSLSSKGVADRPNIVSLQSFSIPFSKSLNAIA